MKASNPRLPPSPPLRNEVPTSGSDELGAVPAIAVTAYHEDEHREKALRSGFDEWLPKPATDAVVALVARLTRR